jgi:hypothetical protein
VSNWATLYRQKTRLPVVPAGVDPRSTWFHCTRYDAQLPRVSCANRYKLSQQRTGDGAAYVAISYGGCLGCRVGAAHAAGLPTPQGTNMDETSTVTTTNGHASKQWPERTCGRCRKKFQPATARERRCTACTKEAAEQPKRARGKGRAPAKLHAGRRGNGVSTTSTTEPSNGTPKPVSAPTARVLNPDQIATAAELLTLAGYTVESVRTPAGEFLRVT